MQPLSSAFRPIGPPSGSERDPPTGRLLQPGAIRPVGPAVPLKMSYACHGAISPQSAELQAEMLRLRVASPTSESQPLPVSRTPSRSPPPSLPFIREERDGVAGMDEDEYEDTEGDDDLAPEISTTSCSTNSAASAHDSLSSSPPRSSIVRSLFSDDAAGSSPSSTSDSPPWLASSSPPILRGNPPNVLPCRRSLSVDAYTMLVSSSSSSSSSSAQPAAAAAMAPPPAQPSHHSSSSVFAFAQYALAAASPSPSPRQRKYRLASQQHPYAMHSPASSSSSFYAHAHDSSSSSASSSFRLARPASRPATPAERVLKRSRSSAEHLQARPTLVHSVSHASLLRAAAEETQDAKAAAAASSSSASLSMSMSLTQRSRSVVVSSSASTSTSASVYASSPTAAACCGSLALAETIARGFPTSVPCATGEYMSCEKYKPKLPLVPTDLEGCNAISPDTLACLLDPSSGACGEGEAQGHAFRAHFDKVIVIDCRFPYEYQGGHISGALNITRPDDLEGLLLNRPAAGPRIALIFHCEFSQKRGPRAALYLRKRDRQIHGVRHFPLLFYPELYVLEGGYKAFFERHPRLCAPQAYRKMKDAAFTVECSRYMGLWKHLLREMEGGSAAPRRTSSGGAYRSSTPSLFAEGPDSDSDADADADTDDEAGNGSGSGSGSGSSSAAGSPADALFLSSAAPYPLRHAATASPLADDATVPVPMPKRVIPMRRTRSANAHAIAGGSSSSSTGSGIHAPRPVPLMNRTLSRDLFDARASMARAGTGTGAAALASPPSGFRSSALSALPLGSPSASASAPFTFPASGPPAPSVFASLAVPSPSPSPSPSPRNVERAGGSGTSAFLPPPAGPSRER